MFLEKVSEDLYEMLQKDQYEQHVFVQDRGVEGSTRAAGNTVGAEEYGAESSCISGGEDNLR